VFFFVKETKGHTLEEIDILFGTVNADQRAEDVEKVLHKQLENEEADVATGGENKATSVEPQVVSVAHTN